MSASTSTPGARLSQAEERLPEFHTDLLKGNKMNVSRGLSTSASDKMADAKSKETYKELHILFTTLKTLSKKILPGRISVHPSHRPCTCPRAHACKCEEWHEQLYICACLRASDTQASAAGEALSRARCDLSLRALCQHIAPQHDTAKAKHTYT